ncbi:MAG: Gfo/Idh/MocA family oxidoreductase [Caldilineaceae bacterium]
MTDQRIRVAIIGTGGIARSHVAAARHEDPRDLAAAVDIDADHVHAFAEARNIPTPIPTWPRCWPQIAKLVMIATPPGTHCDHRCDLEAEGVGAVRKATVRVSGRNGSHRRRRTAHRQLLQQRLPVALRQRRAAPQATHRRRQLGRPLVGTCNTTWYRTHEYAVPWRGKWATPKLSGCHGPRYPRHGLLPLALR